jgi:hypothetical protein
VKYQKEVEEIEETNQGKIRECKINLTSRIFKSLVTPHNVEFLHVIYIKRIYESDVRYI